MVLLYVGLGPTIPPSDSYTGYLCIFGQDMGLNHSYSSLGPKPNFDGFFEKPRLAYANSNTPSRLLLCKLHVLASLNNKKGFKNRSGSSAK